MSTKGKEYEMLIKIAGAIDSSVETSLEKMQKELKQTQSALEQMQGKSKTSFADMTKSLEPLDKGFSKIEQVGKKCFSAIAKAAVVAVPAITAAAVEVFNIGSEFETAFAGVKKTVDATEEEFETLRTGILELSKEIPSTTEEIAGVMEIAGQLGISNDSLLEFTKTMINLGVSTNMTAEDAATSLARFANIVSMKGFAEDGTSNWERLGSTIVALGNNFATTEAEIVEMSYKLASTGDIVGLSESDILALATAMSAVGIKAEAGGSAMAKILKKLQLAVETNSDSLADYARVAGMTGDEFKEVFQKDAVKAFAAFAKGINNTERNGKSAVAVLNDLGINEIRLSNMLLALSSAEGVLDNALELSNDAWGESNALQEEASKRYETVDSQLSILKNSIKDTGIAIYDELRNPAAEAIGYLTDKVQSFSEYLRGPNGISKWVEDARKALPNILTNAKTFFTKIWSAAKPLRNAATWLVKNPKFLANVFIAMGSALASYKIVKGLTDVVKLIGTLTSNAYLAAITALISALSVATTAVANYKASVDAEISDKLHRHFGDITLDMEEIDRIARQLVDPNGSLTFLSTAIENIGNVKNITDSLDALQANIDKYEWKLKVGIKLTDDETAEYKQNIDAYIQMCKDYVDEQQYAVELATAIFIPNYSDSDTKTKLDEYYYYAEDSMAAFGKQLANAVNDAFTGDLLDIDEAKEIAKIRQNMGELQSNIAAGTYEASMKALELNSYGELTPESFQALAERANEIADQASTGYTEAFTTSYSAMKAAGLDTTQLEQEYQKKLIELKTGTTQWLIDTLKDNYGKQIEWFTGTDWEKAGVLKLPGDGTKKANYNDASNYIAEKYPLLRGELATFMPLLLPQVEDLQEAYDAYQKLGGAAIQGIDDVFTDAETINALSGDFGALMSAVFDNSGQNIGDYIEHINLNTKSDDYLPLTDTSAIVSPQQWRQFTPHAAGGMFDTPHLGLVAEAGPESIIPLNGSSRAISLWEKTGRLLGMSGRFDNLDLSGGSGSSTITYSPTLQFYGDAPSKDDLTDALRMSQDEFDMMMERYMKRNRRVSFA